ncbi:Hsp20/alpha crystallin family protein [Bythopirellula polymerisocia]|uniref:Alpha-crystallin n=1 Tax=Bythopirellula polymerisocia TaxID=2528003 RepID=A0A5C6CSX1_9BACT|nr:Hsp20/alpha crystallin family protein [Bythopirellula polymerisocia]TWU27632.1 Alpha-crystallin [Bythopirellula polymerisocia]
MFNLIPWKKQHEESSSSTALGAPFENRLAQFRDEFNSLIDKFWSGNIGEHFSSLNWGVDFDENDTEYVVRAEAPGFEANDFDVQIRGNNLVVSAEHNEEQSNGKNGSIYHYGKFQRSMPLPHGVKADNISARYHSGVLELHVPKGEEAKGKRIPVEAK